MKAIVIPVTPFEQNCSLLCCEETARAVVVDPRGDLQWVVDAADKTGVSIEKILLTHAHIDPAGVAAKPSEHN